MVVNTCAFIEAARQESIDTILDLADIPAGRIPAGGDRVSGRALRIGADRSLPEVDLVAGFGVPVTLRRRNSFDLLNLPRPAARAPWAYIKVAEGCDRRCGFCAIPSFRGRQRSRPTEALLDEVDALGDEVREVVLVAQDLASWGLDRSAADRVPRTRGTSRPIVELIRAVTTRVERVRLLYLYPSALDDELVDTIVDSGVPYFDLSLQHVSRPLVERMRRWGDGTRFLRTDRPDPDRRPRRRAAVVVHPGLPGRDRGGPRRPPRFPDRGTTRLGRVLHLLRGAGDLRRRSRRCGAGRAGPRAPARVLRDPGPDHRRAPVGPGGRDDAGARRRTRSGPFAPRGPGDRRHRPCADDPRARAVSSTWWPPVRPGPICGPRWPDRSPGDRPGHGTGGRRAGGSVRNLRRWRRSANGCGSSRSVRRPC